MYLHDVLLTDAGLDVAHKHRLGLYLGHSGNEGGDGALGGWDALVLPRSRQHLREGERALGQLNCIYRIIAAEISKAQNWKERKESSNFACRAIPEP